MLVSSMTYEEINREVFRDLPVLIKRCAHLYPKWKKEMLKAGNSTDMREFFFRSVYKNTWQVTMKLSETGYELLPVCWFHSNKGFEAYFPLTGQQGWMLRYTAHFFSRYNERLKLGLVKPLDMLRHYFKHNAHSYFDELKKYNADHFRLFYAQSDGIALGQKFIDRQLFVFNTYIAEATLSKRQRKRFNALNKLSAVTDRAKVIY